jgi:hypothetical protein
MGRSTHVGNFTTSLVYVQGAAFFCQIGETSTLAKSIVMTYLSPIPLRANPCLVKLMPWFVARL